jgi:hypothetical protein
MDEIPDERHLVRKLVTRRHLNVPERRALPGGRAKGTLVVAEFENAVLEDDSCTFFDATAGLRQDGSCRVSWTGETSLYRWETYKVQDFASPREAAQTVIGLRKDIDGVPIDWLA